MHPKAATKIAPFLLAPLLTACSHTGPSQSSKKPADTILIATSVKHYVDFSEGYIHFTITETANGKLSSQYDETYRLQRHFDPFTMKDVGFSAVYTKGPNKKKLGSAFSATDIIIALEQELWSLESNSKNKEAYPLNADTTELMQLAMLSDALKDCSKLPVESVSHYPFVRRDDAFCALAKKLVPASEMESLYGAGWSEQYKTEIKSAEITVKNIAYFAALKKEPPYIAPKPIAPKNDKTTDVVMPKKGLAFVKAADKAKPAGDAGIKSLKINEKLASRILGIAGQQPYMLRDLASGGAPRRAFTEQFFDVIEKNGVLNTIIKMLKEKGFNINSNKPPNHKPGRSPMV